MLARRIDLDAVEPYLSNDAWVAQQKLDGDRILITVTDGTVRALNREGEPRRNPVPRRVLDQFQALPGDWVFDGELMTTGDYWVFDLPYAAGIVTPEHPFSFRAAVLERFMAAGQWPTAPCVRLLSTARTTTAKTTLFERLRDGGGEGVMFRHVDGRYRSGKRSDLLLKAKFTTTADVVVHEVRPTGRNNCTFRLFRDGVAVPAGSCSLDARPEVQPGDVIEVRYLYASDDGLLYQPTMVRVRDDKSPGDCTVDQLQFTDRSIVAVNAVEQSRQAHVIVSSPRMVTHASLPNSSGRFGRTLCGVEIRTKKDWLILGETEKGQEADCLKCARKLHKKLVLP